MSSQNPCFPFARQASRLSGVASSGGPSVATMWRIEPWALSPSRSATLAGAVLGRAGATFCLLDFRASVLLTPILSKIRSASRRERLQHPRGVGADHARRSLELQAAQ